MTSGATDGLWLEEEQAQENRPRLANLTLRLAPAPAPATSGPRRALGDITHLAPATSGGRRPLRDITNHPRQAMSPLVDMPRPGGRENDPNAALRVLPMTAFNSAHLRKQLRMMR